MIEAVLFYIGAAVAVAFALGVVLAKSPLRGALSLVVSLCGVALLFLLLNASFVAAMQILVYAGAIMVLFIFVIMMLNLGPDAGARPAYLSIAKLLGGLAAAYFACRIAVDATGVGWLSLAYAGAIIVVFGGVVFAVHVLRPASAPAVLIIAGCAATCLVTWIIVTTTSAKQSLADVPSGFGSVKTVGLELLTTYLFAFEAISVLLLVAVVGAVVLGLKRLT